VSQAENSEAIEIPFAFRTRVGPGKHLLHIADRFEANNVLCSFDAIQPSSLVMQVFLTLHNSLYLYTCQTYDISSWLSNQSGAWWYMVIANKTCTYLPLHLLLYSLLHFLKWHALADLDCKFWGAKLGRDSEGTENRDTHGNHGVLASWGGGMAPAP